MRRTLTVKPKVPSILDILEDDTSFKLKQNPTIRVGIGSGQASLSEKETEVPSRNSSRRASNTDSCASVEPESSRRSSLSSEATNSNFHVRKGISTSTNLSKG